MVKKYTKRSVPVNMFYGAGPSLFSKAWKLRQDMTNAEKLLWEEIKNKQLGVHFRAQHPIDRYIADFYCHQSRLVVEVDGGVHDNQKEYDIGRQAEMENYGIKVIRFTNQQVQYNIGEVLKEIKKHL